MILLLLLLLFRINNSSGNLKIQTYSRSACVPCGSRTVNENDLDGAPLSKPTGKVSIEILGFEATEGGNAVSRSKSCVTNSLLVCSSRRRWLSTVTMVTYSLAIDTPQSKPLENVKRHKRYNQYLWMYYLVEKHS